MIKYLFKAFLPIAVAMIVHSTAMAQDVSRQRIVSGLGKVTARAPIVDMELLRQEAMNGAGKQMSALPNWSKVAKLPQMVVEINFVNDSVAIEPKSYRTLGLLADALHHPNLWRYKYLVIGHASAPGDEKHNFDLSEQRAAAIKEVLSTTFAVDPQRLYAIGVGENFPIPGSNGDAADRRVQLVNLGVFTRKQ